MFEIVTWLIEFSLQFLNLLLKLSAFIFSFGLQSNDMVLGLFSNFDNSLVVFILKFSLFSTLFDVLFIPGTFTFARSQFFTKHVDLTTEMLILGLGHVQSDSLIVYHFVAGHYLNLSHFFL